MSADQHSEIDGIIDIPLIKQQVKHGAFDWNSCTRLVHSVVSVIERIQESRRAEQTSEMYALVRAEMEHVTFSGTSDLWPRVLCKALDFLLNRISALRIDAANSRLRTISGLINRQGANFERDKFATRIRNCEITLVRVEVQGHS